MNGRGGVPDGRLRSRSPRANASNDPVAFWTEAVERDWRRFQQAPPDIRATPGVVAEAMRHSEGRALRWASEELRADGEFLLGAAQEIGVCILGHAAEKLRADREFMLEASQELGPAVLQQCSPQLAADRDFVLEVADYLPVGDMLNLAPEEVCNVLLADRGFVQEAVHRVGVEVLQGASPTLRGDREFMLELANYCGPAAGEVLEYATEELRGELFADNDFVLQALRDTGIEVLEDASPELRANREFIMEAASYYSLGEVIPYASDALRAELDPNWTGPTPSSLDVDMSGCDSQQVPAGVAGSWNFEDLAHEVGDGWNSTEPMCPTLEPALEPPPLLGVWPGLPGVWPTEQFVDCTQIDPGPPAPEPQVDRQAVLAALRLLGPQAIENASSELRGDREFMLAAAASKAEALRHASDQLRQELSGDKDFMLQVVHEIGADVFEYAAPSLRGDREFVMQAAPTPGSALRYASQSLREVLHSDREFMLKAIQEVGESALQDTSLELRGDREFIFAVTQSTGDALRYASPSLRKQLHADRTFMLKAVKEGGASVLCHASKELRADRDFILQAVSTPMEALWYASQSLRKKLQADREFMLKFVREAGTSVLKTTSADLRGNREFILEATPTAAEALKWASPSLRTALHGDKAFMLRAVQEIGKKVLQDASADLRADREFVLQVAPAPKEALEYASQPLRDTLRGDREFMAKAVKELGASMLEHASEELRGDLGFMFQVAACCPPGEAMKYATEQLRAELDDEDND